MKRLLLSALAIVSINAMAQELPQPSPSATLSQRIGLTDFTVEYSRPAARGREIYGNLVPYGQLWRTGANKATAIEFNTPVLIGETEVEAGKYSIFTIPNQDEWVFILNANTELWGTDGYEETKDVVRMSVASMKTDNQENFSIDFNSIDGGNGNLMISWAGQGISVPLKVNVEEKAIQNIEQALGEAQEEDLWRVNRNAATYYLRTLKKAPEALNYIQQSVEQNPDNWYSHLVHGEALYANGKAKEAVKAAKKAMELGQAGAKAAGREFGYASMIEESIAKWSK